MKNNSLFSVLVFLLFPLVLMAQELQYTINIKIKNKDPKAMVYIVQRHGWADQLIIDSAQSTNGKYQFKGFVAEPTLVKFIIDHTGSGKVPSVKNVDAQAFYLENGSIHISSIDSAKTAQIKGKKINNTFKSYQHSVLEQVTKYSRPLLEEIEREGKLASSKTDLNFSKKINLYINKIGAYKDSLVQNFILNNRDSYVSWDALQAMGNYDMSNTQFQDLFKQLGTAVLVYPSLQKTAQFMQSEQGLVVGVAAPDFSQPDVDGKEVKLSDFKGKYVLLDFWASWCSPCRAENPHVVKAFHKYKSKNFTVLGVSLDKQSAKAAWLKAIQNDQLQEWTNVSDLTGWNNAAAKSYNVNAIPKNFLIGPDGKIVAKNLRGAALDEYLGKLLD